MADEPPKSQEDQESQSISSSDLVRLKHLAQSLSPSDRIRIKHQLGKSITWGKSDLNALEVEQLELTAEDYRRIRKEYRDWHKGLNLDNRYVLAVIVLACVGAYFFVPYFWLKIVAIGIGVTTVAAIVKREGHAEGYIDGYDAGHEAGVHKALGIRPEEMQEMHEMATDMKIHEMTVQRVDERKAKESENKTKP